VFFTRPSNHVVLRALVEDSPVIAEAVKNNKEKNFETGATAEEWFARRIKYQRMNNRKVRYYFVGVAMFYETDGCALGSRNMDAKSRDRSKSLSLNGCLLYV
jgi:hypothetical protein